MGDPNPLIEKSDNKYRLDTVWLENIAATYPPEIREDFLWLATYFRERCSRHIDVICDHIKKLGFKTHSTTISRILRGKLLDEEGKPIMRLAVLKELVEALRAQERIEAMAGKVPFVETPTWQDIKDYIDVRRAPGTVCKFGLIIGPTGTQKTACLKQYVLRNNHGTCVHLEAPESGSISKFITDLAYHYGVSLNAISHVKRNRITESVNDRKTIIVDNVQRLYRARSGWNQPVFNYLQRLQDDTGCTVILCSIPDFEETLREGMDKGYFEQFEGRCGGRHEFLILPPYPPKEDVDMIAKAFELQDYKAHSKELVALAHLRGRVRVLFNALQKAKTQAGKRPLTIHHVRAVIGVEEE